MGTITALPSELLLQIFDILADHWIDERRDYTRDCNARAIWVTTRSNCQVKPCSLVCKQWSKLSLPYVDWLLRLSVKNMDGIISFIRQSKTRRSHVKHLFVNFPGESQVLDKKANSAALWGALREVLETVGDQLQTMDILLWAMEGSRQCPPPEARLRLPSNISDLWVRTSSAMTNPVLQDWFTGLEECKALSCLELRDIHASQSSPALFALRHLVISAILPTESTFFSASATTLTSLTAFWSDSFGSESFWPTFFPLLHLVKGNLRELDMDGSTGGILVRYDKEDQLVAPILPSLTTLKLTSAFLGNLVDSFPHLRLSLRLVRLKLKKVPIMVAAQDAQAQEFQCHFRHLQRLTLRSETKELTVKLIRPLFDPILHPHILRRLDTELTAFVSAAELKSFLQISQPRILDIFLESSFETLDFLLTSGHTIPGIQDMRLSGSFFKPNSRWGDCIFHSSSFSKGSCAAKSLEFRFRVASSWRHYSSYVTDYIYVGDGGYTPLITFLSAATWTDQLANLRFQHLSHGVPTIDLNRQQWSNYESLMDRLGRRFEVTGLEFFKASGRYDDTE
ncbi:hypothetical protein BT69DRAFT_1280280 [Atractiella rhizophila]|nr:hypothetical protein BT69DRAFT_1280280 [Atractiella rhizophila]